MALGSGHNGSVRRTPLIVAALLLAGCLPNNEPDDPLAAQLEELRAEEETTVDGSEEPVSVTPTVSEANDPLWLQLKLDQVPMVEVENPTALVTRSGSIDLWVSQRSGTVRRISRSFNKRKVENVQLIDAPVLDISTEVSRTTTGGLINLTFSSDGRKLYVFFVDLGGDIVVSEYNVTSRRVADLESRRDLLRIAAPGGGNYGGGMAFGPDGFFYVGVGDGGGGGDPDGNAQDPSTLLGSVLRIDPTASESAAYTIPPGNPYADDANGRDEIWATGLHDPSRLSFDPTSGDLWLADVGEERVEEINRITAAEGGGIGDNLGWPLTEGNQSDSAAVPTGQRSPYLVYSHSEGRCRVTGGLIYSGKLMEILDGVYLYGDYCTGEIFAAEPTDEGPLVRSLAVSARPRSLVAFGTDVDGEIYIVEETGLISRIQPALAVSEED